MTTILIRADAAPAIGIGHVMRCLALAEALRDGGDTPVFAAACLPEALSRRILDGGHALRAVQAATPGDASDLASTIELARDVGAGGVVLDGYHFDEGWRQVLRRAVPPLLLFDDLADGQALTADLVVNYSPAAFALPYGTLAPRAALLLGPSYAPLRREILDARDAARLPLLQRARLLISFGGSDPTGLTQEVLAALPALLPPSVAIDVVCGPGTAGLDAVRAAAAPHASRVALHLAPPDLANLMAGAGLALTAGGVTMGELAALGVPSLVCVAVDNQDPGARAAAEGGWAETYDARGAAGAGGEIARRAASLWQDPVRRERLAQAAAGTFDGRGAERIAAALKAAIAARRPA